ncbi:efflux RND transporter periplasmic adaptor subunit [Pontibacter anaerobius]|uniref:Efflux RND transporter periplasmic adaptor subunit n=1 Tax=Pontibacter anaerobius TaxID=2993940 RepID=A0ABT3RC50_9BACT|nr:efflux RND transporter periplasmic adaptor subunit [Pontibacter anaerobius]MCX2739011.1 efflux RND transporter periplasmic adaptor subunit [Pontibacter anaerobius]
MKKRFFSHSVVSGFFYTIVLLSLGACTGSAENTQVSQENEQVTVPKVPVVTVQRDQPEYALSLPGELQPYEQVDIYPKVKGFIKTLHVDRGSHVKQGQVLATLEAPEVNQQLSAAKAQAQKLYEDFVYSKQALKRLQQAAAKDGAVAAIELDRASTKVRSDSAAYVAAKASASSISSMRGYLTIKAPFDGIITARNFSVGALVGEASAQATPLFSVAQQSRLRLVVAVPEKHAQSLDEDTPLTFTVSNRPGKVFHATLSRNSKVLNQKLRSVNVEFDVDNRENALSGGEYAQVQLKLQRPDSTVWVPASSVVNAQSGVFVLKVENNKVQRVPVVEGMRRENLQEVFGNVTTGDLVVLKGSEELKEKSKIQPVKN